MSEELNLEEIGARCEKATPGPWMWNLNLKSKKISLEAQISSFEIVMDFARWGFGSACPRFQQHLSGCGGIMHMAHEMGKIVEKRRHHSDWYQTIEHPDADFIAHARTDVPALCREVRRLRDWQTRAVKAMDDGDCYLMNTLCKEAEKEPDGD